jgi:nicotinamide-nucleotide amidase
MTCAIMSIGTELTRGELVNSNAAWLGAELTAIGFEVAEHAVIDDDRGRIGETLGRLAARARVIIATGGLGPTPRVTLRIAATGSWSWTLIV